MTMGTADQRPMFAKPGNNATDFYLTGSSMANIRTANKRHKRAIVVLHRRKKSAGNAVEATSKPVKAAR